MVAAAIAGVAVLEYAGSNFHCDVLNARYGSKIWVSAVVASQQRLLKCQVVTNRSLPLPSRAS